MTILCVRLNNWPIQRFERQHRRRFGSREAGRGDGSQFLFGPLILIRTVGSKRHVIAHCDAAKSAGLHVGITPAEANAICAGLRCEPHEPERDLRALESLGRWLMRYTPDVALDPPDALLLNVDGCERLFGGLDALAASVRNDLERLCIKASIAIAPTAIAAWALATYCPSGSLAASRKASPSTSRATSLATSPLNSPLNSPATSLVARLCMPEQLHEALASLPLAALRLEPEMSKILRQLGIRTIGQVAALPGVALPARFGAALGMQLDRAYGQRPEILLWLPHRSPIRETVEYEDGVRSLEGIWHVLSELIDAGCEDLARRGCGARLLRIGLRDTDGIWSSTDVALSRPSRTPATLFELVRCALEDISTKRASDSYTGFEVEIPLFCRIDDVQIELLDQERQETDADRDQLIGRLMARLGPGAVVRPQAIESHLPERACVDRQVVNDPDLPGARSVREAKPRAIRPLCLLPTPVEVPVVVEPSDTREGRPRQLSYDGHVHVLVHVKGPERIAGEWWRGHSKTRDYFDVLDERGLRFWLFRVIARIDEDHFSTRWFLHGRFT